MTIIQFPGRPVATQPPTGGNGMEPRIAKLESDVGHVRENIADIKVDMRSIRDKMDTHFYITWGGIIALAGLMAKGFGWF